MVTYSENSNLLLKMRVLSKLSNEINKVKGINLTDLHSKTEGETAPLR